MNESLLLLGPESSVIYYNLNKQFSTLKRLIITKDYLLEEFKKGEFKESIQKLSESSQEEFLEALHNGSLKQSLLEGEFSNEFYSTLQETLAKMYENFSEVKLKDYNFMSAVSNNRFTLTLRSAHFSKSKYNLEKGTLLSGIKQLLIDYLSYEGNIHRLKELAQFQIECYLSEEVSKQVFLKKDGNKLVLSASFAFPRKDPFDHQIGPEIYFSEGERFYFFKNSQEIAFVREHNKMEELEIHSQEKVLSNENLVAVNETSKRINDATIELLITKKGAIHIAHVSLLESNLEKGKEEGILFNKSAKNYNKVSLLTLRDSIDEEKPNPKYLLLRNSDEIKEALESPLCFSQVDGIILCTPFFSSYLDKVAMTQDLDFLFINKELSKNLEQEIEVSELQVLQEEQRKENPFAGIIKEQDKKRDDFLERLKNLNLDTHRQEGKGQRNSEIDALAQSIISSPQSSTKSYHSPTQQSSSGGETMYSQQGVKKSAIQMLASSVIANDQKPIQEKSPEIEEKKQSSFLEKVRAEDLQQPSEETLNNFAQTLQENQSSSSTSQETTSTQTNHIEVYERDTIIESTSPIDTTRYDFVLATTLISSPPLTSDAYFLDSSQDQQASSGKTNYVLVNSEEEMTNKNTEYIIAANVCKGRSKKGSVLINTPKDFFSVFPKQQKVMVNLVALEPFMKKRMLDKCIEDFGVLSGVILYQEDLGLLAESINKVEAVYVKDLEDDSQVQRVKQELLRYEKEFLMRK